MDYSHIKLSIAIVTRNRPASLDRTLKSLRAQEVHPWEVIVSDDSDDEHSAEAVALAKNYGCRYLSGPRRGLYANRNHVALACRGTHIRTMDDDHEFPADHNAACLDAVVLDPKAIWIIGEYLPTQQKHQMPDCPGQLHPRGFSVMPPDPQNCWAISDGASVYPRVIFDCGLRYLDDYKFGAAYLEFGSRLHWLGYRIRHLSKTYIIHHYDPATRSSLDLRTDLASRFCAMLCHAYIYQPTPVNQAFCRMEMLKQIVLHRGLALKAISEAGLGFNRQRNHILGHAASCQASTSGKPKAHKPQNLMSL